MSLLRSVTSRVPVASSSAGVVAAVALAGVLTSCGAPSIQPENVLFREASLALEDESYATAIDNYKKLLEEYPFSGKAEVASLNIAYAHYLKKQYPEAIGAFNDFERLYPVSPLLPFVSYTIGMCWLDQAKSGDRDPTASDEALRQFKKVASEFPKTIYADLATFRQQQARENLAAHEIVVGDYYRQRDKMVAAAGRYKYVMTEYPLTENAGRAAARLQEVETSAVEQEKFDKAKEAEKLKAEDAAKKPEQAEETAQEASVRQAAKQVAETREADAQGVNKP